jgi:hypothetical protein
VGPNNRSIEKKRHHPPDLELDLTEVDTNDRATADAQLNLIAPMSLLIFYFPANCGPSTSDNTSSTDDAVPT